MPEAFILVHKVGESSWDTTRVKSGRDGIDLDEITKVLGIGTAAFIRVGEHYLLVCDENGMLKGSKPSVGIRLQGGVQMIYGPAALVRNSPKGLIGLAAEDEHLLQTRFPWCAPSEAATRATR